MTTRRLADSIEQYEKALKVEIEHMAGVNAPYDEPLKPEVLLNTDQLTPEEAAEDIARPCQCGISNKPRAVELFQRLAAKEAALQGRPAGRIVRIRATAKE